MPQLRTPAHPFLAAVLLLFLAAAVGATTPRAVARPEGRLRLLVTHPIGRYLQCLLDLAAAHRLGGGNLEIVGVYHEDEAGDYHEARSLVSSHPAAAACRLEILRGAIAPEEIWTRNRLSGSFRRLFLQADGILFTGGPDLPPALYGEKTLLTTVITDPKRHRWELSFLAHLVGGSKSPTLRPFMMDRPDLPLLCICLGMQSLNVAAGGSLIQDLPSQIYGCKTVEEVLALDGNARHRNYHRALGPEPLQDSGSVHVLRRTAPWPFAPRIPEACTPRVVSVHHQAVKVTGAGLTVIARSLDGKVIEALRHDRFRQVLAVQFHPERPQVFQADRPERSGAMGPTTASFFAGDPESRRFHEDLWFWMSEAMRQSHMERVLVRRRHRRR